MINSQYRLEYPKIGECYEFCKVIDKINYVLYGRLIAINPSNKTVTFEQLDNGLVKKKTGSYYTDITAIRGVYFDYPKA